MCKAYDVEPTVNLFRGFFNYYPSGKWLTFSKRHGKHIPELLPKVITRIDGWKGRFFFVQDYIVPYNCSELLSKDNSMRVFPYPILFLAGLKSTWERGQQHPAIIVGGREMSFRNFMYAETKEDLAFHSKEPSDDIGVGYPSASVNAEPPIMEVEHANQIVENIADSVRSGLDTSELLTLSRRGAYWREEVTLEASNIFICQEVEDVKKDRAEVVSKVVPYVVMELVHSDKLDMLVGRLAFAFVFYGKCDAFEEVAKMTKSFDLATVKMYRPAYKEKHTKAINDLATATFPFLSEVVADPHATIKELLSKNFKFFRSLHLQRLLCPLYQLFQLPPLLLQARSLLPISNKVKAIVPSYEQILSTSNG
ncbi:hypothetical protein Tco_0575555 [Tanacetum coccineum]